MTKSKQLSLFDSISGELREGKFEQNRKAIPLSHGGKSSKRKSARPLSSQKTIHLVWKSSKAIGEKSFLAEENSKFISKLLLEKSKHYGITIQDFANGGDHLHLAIRYRDRKLFQNFLRVVPALIARKIQGARKGHPKGKFWDELSHTRVLISQFERMSLKGYFEANRIEIQKGRGARLDFWQEKLDQLKQLKKKP